MKKKICTLLCAFLGLFSFVPQVFSQAGEIVPTTATYVIDGITDYNIIWTNPADANDYYLSRNTTTSGDLHVFELKSTSARQALRLTKEATNTTYGSRFRINLISDLVWYFNETWKCKNSGYNAGWNAFYFTRDPNTGLYAIKPRANNETTSYFVAPTLQSDGKYRAFLGSGTGSAVADITTNADLFCFKLVAAYTEPATPEQKAALNTEITTATTLYTSTTEGDGLGQFTTTNRTTLNAAVGSAQAVYDNAAATGTDVQSAISSLQATEITYKNSVNVETNALADGTYFVKITDGTDMYFMTDPDPQTSTSDWSVDFELQRDGVDFQKFVFTKDASVSRYRIDAKYRLDNTPAFFSASHLKETAKVASGTTAYQNAWHSFTVKFDGTHYAIQRGGSAGTNYWVPKSYAASSQINSTATASLYDALVFDISAIGVPTKVSNVANEEIEVNVSGKRIFSNNATQLTIYGFDGRLIRTVKGDSRIAIELPQGQYIVKALSPKSVKVLKVSIK